MTLIDVRIDPSSPPKTIGNVLEFYRFDLARLVKSSPRTGKVYETTNIVRNLLSVPIFCDMYIYVPKTSDVAFALYTYVFGRGFTWVEAYPGDEVLVVRGAINPGNCRIPPYYVKFIPVKSGEKLRIEASLRFVLRYVSP